MTTKTDERSEDWRAFPKDDGLTPLLSASLDLFVARGYHAASMRMIADHAGITVPGLYYHFKGKSDILLELIERAHVELRTRLDAALTEAGEKPYNRFVNFVETVVLFMSHRWRLSLIPREMDSLEGDLAAYHKSLRDQIQEILVRIVEDGVESGAFKSPNPRGDARAVLVLCRGVAQWYSPEGSQSPEEIAHDYIRHSLAIVRGRTASFS